MTTTPTITPGQRVGNWEILSVDPSGKRVCCACVCGTVRILSVAALLDGTATPSCGCRPLTPAQRSELRAEQARAAADREAAE
jgi:hypothetical protein